MALHSETFTIDAAGTHLHFSRNASVYLDDNPTGYGQPTIYTVSRHAD